jgi:hypothetical protein
MCDSPLLLRETKSRGSYSYIFRKWREIPLNRFHTRLRVVGVDGTRCGSGEYRCAVRTVTDWKRQNCQRGGQRIAIGKQAGKVKKKTGGYLLCCVGVTGEGAGGEGGDGGGVEARGGLAGGGEGVVREGQGAAPRAAAADEGAGEAGADPDDEEHADAEAEQRERGAGGHGARHGGGGEEEGRFQLRGRGMGNERMPSGGWTAASPSGSTT